MQPLLRLDGRSNSVGAICRRGSEPKAEAEDTEQVKEAQRAQSGAQMNEEKIASIFREELAALRPETAGPPPFDFVAELKIIGEVLFSEPIPAWFDPEDCYLDLARYTLTAAEWMRAAGRFPPIDKSPIPYFAEAMFQLGLGTHAREDLAIIFRDHSSANIENACRIVADFAERRRILAKHEMVCAVIRCKSSTREDIEKVLAEAERVDRRVA